jgi:DNA-binding XRE family transcriptional regulator
MVQTIGGVEMRRNNVQQFRESLMMSKTELARKAGLSSLTVDRVESGRPCRLDTKRKILFALGLRVSDKDQIFVLSPVVSEQPRIEAVLADDDHPSQ